MGSARFFDSNNKKHFNARYLVAHIRTHEGYSSAVPPEWLEDKQPDSRDLRKLLSQEPVTAVSLPFATQLIASNSYSPVEPITTAPVPAAFEVTVDTLEYTDLHSKGGTLLQICYCSIWCCKRRAQVLCGLSDDVYKGSRLFCVRACLQLHLWAGWKHGRSEAGTLAGALHGLLCY